MPRIHHKGRATRSWRLPSDMQPMRATRRDTRQGKWVPLSSGRARGERGVRNHSAGVRAAIYAHCGPWVPWSLVAHRLGIQVLQRLAAVVSIRVLVRRVYHPEQAQVPPEPGKSISPGTATNFYAASSRDCGCFRGCCSRAIAQLPRKTPNHSNSN